MPLNRKLRVQGLGEIESDIADRLRDSESDNQDSEDIYSNNLEADPITLLLPEEQEIVDNLEKEQGELDKRYEREWEAWYNEVKPSIDKQDRPIVDFEEKKPVVSLLISILNQEIEELNRLGYGYYDDSEDVWWELQDQLELEFLHQNKKRREKSKFSEYLTVAKGRQIDAKKKAYKAIAYMLSSQDRSYHESRDAAYNLDQYLSRLNPKIISDSDLAERVGTLITDAMIDVKKHYQATIKEPKDGLSVDEIIDANTQRQRDLVTSIIIPAIQKYIPHAANYISWERIEEVDQLPFIIKDKDKKSKADRRYRFGSNDRRNYSPELNGRYHQPIPGKVYTPTPLESAPITATPRIKLDSIGL